MLRHLRWALPLLILLPLLAACQPITPVVPTQGTVPLPTATAVAAAAPAAPAPRQAVMLEPQGFVRKVHDPVIAREGDTYYVFSTGARIMILKSTDLVNWEFVGRVFDDIPKWAIGVNASVGDLWAPDISFYNGLWHLYYAVSSMGAQNSAIGLATSPTLDPASPDYAWEDRGIVVQSQPGGPYNTIDPALALDENGTPWLAWGSYWTGLYMQQVDPATGLLADGSESIHIADRAAGPDNDPAIEASFIVRHGDSWYLFASFDHCCQGADSNYNVRVGRSDAITGPYVDRDGVPMLAGGGTTILKTYGRWHGPGHNGMLIDNDGTYWIVYHAYDAQLAGTSFLRIESIAWDADGWPSLPSQTENTPQ